jgi:hypothetical protein
MEHRQSVRACVLFVRGYPTVSPAHIVECFKGAEKKFGSLDCWDAWEESGVISSEILQSQFSDGNEHHRPVRLVAVLLYELCRLKPSAGILGLVCDAIRFTDDECLVAAKFAGVYRESADTLAHATRTRQRVARSMGFLLCPYFKAADTVRVFEEALEGLGSTDCRAGWTDRLAAFPSGPIRLVAAMLCELVGANAHPNTVQAVCDAIDFKSDEYEAAAKYAIASANLDGFATLACVFDRETDSYKLALTYPLFCYAVDHYDPKNEKTKKLLRTFFINAPNGLFEGTDCLVRMQCKGVTGEDIIYFYTQAEETNKNIHVVRAVVAQNDAELLEQLLKTLVLSSKERRRLSDGCAPKSPVWFLLMKNGITV